MHKETIESVAQVAVRTLVKEHGTDVDHLDLSEWLGSELPGLESDAFDAVLAKAQEYLDIVEVHVDIPFWRLDKEDPLNQLM